jgi:hypothetical protein
VDKEFDSLDRARTWYVVNKVEEGKEVGSKWVLKVTRRAVGKIDKFKVQLVAQGFMQRPGFNFDKIYARIVCFEAWYLLLAITALQDWYSQHMDIQVAILDGDLEEEIYMRLRRGRWEKGKPA